jgi:hypothetical protein
MASAQRFTIEPGSVFKQTENSNAKSKLVKRHAQQTATTVQTKTASAACLKTVCLKMI